MIVKVLLGLPINKVFIYRVNEKSNKIPFKIGNLVEVDFRGSKKIGVIVGTSNISSLKKIKNISKIFKSLIIKKQILSAIKFYSFYTCNRMSDLTKILLSNFNPKTLTYRIDNEKGTIVKGEDFFEKKLFKLNEQQKKSIQKIEKTGLNKFNVFVLDGVTGSGKTRVYLNLLSKISKSNFQCLILIPEIFLTKQWIQNFAQEFGFDPHIYHSSIKKTEKTNIWIGVATGKINLVVGTRSALFLPFIKLGLLVIDEEHDISYKQEEGVIFNSRDYGIVLAKNFNCPVILASATPSIETIFNCKVGKYKHISLKKRVKNLPLPKLNIIDMREGRKNKHSGWISKQLELEIKETLKEKKQTLLFLNKRGYAPVVICPLCGKSKICPKCDYSLVLHKNYKKYSNDYLTCHWCEYQELFDTFCNNCKKKSLISIGPGIQKIFEETKNLFPNARVLMVSSDTISKKNHMEKVINSIISREIDIIIGTQIISKGHNFPDISTVGIINIDNQLKSFDIRSNEKIFQMLTQVAGRAGREYLSRGVFIQTFYPKDNLIKLCVKKTKEDFYNFELIKRKKNNEPPFCSLISLINQNKNLNLLQSQNEVLKQKLKKFKNLSVYGPSPSPIFKIRNKFRYRFLLKFSKDNKEKNVIKEMLLNLKNNKSLDIKIDVDPLSFI